MPKYSIVDIGVHPLVLVGLTFLFQVLVLDISDSIVVHFVCNRELMQAKLVNHQVIYDINPLSIIVLFLLEANPRPLLKDFFY